MYLIIALIDEVDAAPNISKTYWYRGRHRPTSSSYEKKCVIVKSPFPILHGPCGHRVSCGLEWLRFLSKSASIARLFDTLEHTRVDFRRIVPYHPCRFLLLY